MQIIGEAGEPEHIDDYDEVEEESGNVCFDQVSAWRYQPVEMLRPPFPDWNDPTFPQQTHYPGLRGTKVSLENLCDGIDDVATGFVFDDVNGMC